MISIISAANRPHPSSKHPPFSDEDPRLSVALTTIDPRIHFALVCGAKVGLLIELSTDEGRIVN